MNYKNLNYEIETISAPVHDHQQVTMNYKNLNYEIETSDTTLGLHADSEPL